MGVSFLVAVGCLAVVASYLQLVQLVDYQWEPVLDEEDYVDIWVTVPFSLPSNKNKHDVKYLNMRLIKHKGKHLKPYLLSF